MPRPKSQAGRHRLNLVLSTRFRERIERLKLDTDADSLTEVLRESSAYYEALVEVQIQGGKVIHEDANGVQTVMRYCLS